MSEVWSHVTKVAEPVALISLRSYLISFFLYARVILVVPNTLGNLSSVAQFR